MDTKSQSVIRPAHDLGGLPAGPVVQDDQEMTPFEKNCHALLNVLDRHLLVNTEEKRRGVENLGEKLIATLSYYDPLGGLGGRRADREGDPHLGGAGREDGPGL